MIKATLNSGRDSYIMNNVFDNIVGGILDKQLISLCTNNPCSYMIQLNISKVSKFIIESFLISDIEELSIYHPNEFYD